jgi:hypothetical protein
MIIWVRVSGSKYMDKQATRFGRGWHARKTKADARWIKVMKFRTWAYMLTCLKVEKSDLLPFEAEIWKTFRCTIRFWWYWWIDLKIFRTIFLQFRRISSKSAYFWLNTGQNCPNWQNSPENIGVFIIKYENSWFGLNFWQLFKINFEFFRQSLQRTYCKKIFKIEVCGSSSLICRRT